MKKNQWWQATRTVMVVSVLSVTTIGCSENEMVTRAEHPAAQITAPQAAQSPRMLKLFSSAWPNSLPRPSNSA